VHELKLERARVGYCRQMARKALRACASACPYGWPRDTHTAAEAVLPGFIVVELELLPQGACAIVDMEDRSIGVNGALSPPRQRFAIAHEIGHVVLNHPQYVFAAAGKQDTILEREADIFAGEFLVPRKALQQAFRECRDYAELAQRFEVEREVMYYRFRETGLWKQVV
jgi:Zn-dependent peptidase ImmA (M78 family)